MADIKPLIKADPEAQGNSPAPAFEDDIYEDEGDLEFNTDPNYQKVFLARIPRELWEAWSHLDEDAEIQIGTVRVATKPPMPGRPANVGNVPFLLGERLLLTCSAADFHLHAPRLQSRTAPASSQRI